jgi:hypothetical protein
MTRRHRNTAALWALLLPGLCFAGVGKVVLLEGTATRTPKQGGAAQALAPGAEVELGDTLRVGKASNLKIVLNDESALMVGAGSELTIDEARFEGLQGRSFSAKLLLGKVWAKVTGAVSGSESKFEVVTERAVAGVRGTIFRVDATKLLSGSTSRGRAITTVRVAEGKVAVVAMVKRTAAAAPPARPGEKKPRVQVQGPVEISKDEWEKKFVELQANQQITVGEELWKEAAWAPEQDQDAFAQFIKAND